MITSEHAQEIIMHIDRHQYPDVKETDFFTIEKTKDDGTVITYIDCEVSEITESMFTVKSRTIAKF